MPTIAELTTIFDIILHFKANRKIFHQVMPPLNTRFSCAALLLNNESSKIKKEAKKNGIEFNNYDLLVAFSHQVYTSTQLRSISKKLKKFHAGLLNEKEIEILNRKLKKPKFIELTDKVEILNEKADFKRLRNDDKVLAGCEMENCIVHGIQNYTCVQKIYESNRKVYAIRLKNEVAGNIKFKKHNPDWDGKTDAFYIGETGKTRLERYNQHLEGIKSNSFVRRFAFLPFETAECSEYLADLLAGSGINIPIENLRHYQALDSERKMTEHLRQLGYGVYSG